MTNYARTATARMLALSYKRFSGSAGQELKFLILLALLLLVSTVHAKAADNIAQPDKHPYANPKGGREHVRLGDEKINQYRLYNFYERQADYYLKNPSKIPAVLPAFPGLDGGLHGHWGKYNNNSFVSDVWSKMDIGKIVTMYATFQQAKERIGVPRAVSVKMAGGVCAYFDPETLTYPAVWRGKFLNIPKSRFGIVHGFTPGEVPIITTAFKNGKRSGSRSGFQYKGYYRSGDTPVFSYETAGVSILETPESIVWGQEFLFCRTLSFSNQDKKSRWRTLVFVLKKEGQKIESLQNTGDLKIWQVTDGNDLHIVAFRANREAAVNLSLSKRGELFLEVESNVPDLARLYHTKVKKEKVPDVLEKIRSDKISDTPKQRAKIYPTMWPQTIALKGTIGENRFPYVVDEIPVPFENPWRSVMFLSGVDFLSNGDAVACTLTGEVWYITGIDKELDKVTWKRFAVGLDKPFGMTVIDDKIYVGCHSQIVRLHDLNGDKEADFYETFDSRFKPSWDHSKSFGLDADKDGNFYVYAANRSYKLPADRNKLAILLSDGTRSAMGFGVNPDGVLLIAPQEGGWTPASMIIKAEAGKHYGFNTRDRNIAPPLCYIPRAVDNSTGGMVWVDSPDWGPLRKQFVGLSYGNGTLYSILMDKNPAQQQAAIVPLPIEFRSGVVRGRINPKDGQFYCAGTDGWGNYSIDPGCLSRVRYTGKPYHQPIGFQVYWNGVLVDFDVPLDPRTSLKNAQAFCQQWNYEYSSRYGSPEYSIRKPQQLGHDPVEVTALQLSKDRKSVFVEMPSLIPAMQLHIRLHLNTANGERIKPSLYTTIHKMSQAYSFPGQQQLVAGKARELRLRSQSNPTPRKSLIAGRERPGSLVVKIHAKDKLLAFYPPRFAVAAGKPVHLIFDNQSRLMPHNLVILRAGRMEAVGIAADKMASRSDALVKHYVPDVEGVIAHTYIAQPERKTELHFLAPKEPGIYPFVCTFPGHWQLMRGEMIVTTGDPAAVKLETSANVLATKLIEEGSDSLAAAARKRGDAKRGAALFYKKTVSCANCHDPETGPTLGPKLFEPREGVTDSFLVESVLLPSRKVRKGFESVTVLLKDGRVQTGYKVKEDDKVLTLRNPSAGGKLVRIPKDKIDEQLCNGASSMPKGLANQLDDRQQFLDLARYLMEIYAGGEKRAAELKASLAKAQLSPKRSSP